MKYMFASDIHGSASFCQRMLEAYDREGAQKLVLLGDLLYHGPRNDLPEEYAPKKVIAMLNERKEEMFLFSCCPADSPAGIRHTFKYIPWI